MLSWVEHEKSFITSGPKDKFSHAAAQKAEAVPVRQMSNLLLVSMVHFACSTVQRLSAIWIYLWTE